MFISGQNMRWTRALILEIDGLLRDIRHAPPIQRRSDKIDDIVSNVSRSLEDAEAILSEIRAALTDVDALPLPPESQQEQQPRK